MRLSAIVVAFGKESLLEECVSRLAAAVGRVDGESELIVVLNHFSALARERLERRTPLVVTVAGGPTRSAGSTHPSSRTSRTRTSRGAHGWPAGGACSRRARLPSTTIRPPSATARTRSISSSVATAFGCSRRTRAGDSFGDDYSESS